MRKNDIPEKRSLAKNKSQQAEDVTKEEVKTANAQAEKNTFSDLNGQSSNLSNAQTDNKLDSTLANANKPQATGQAGSEQAGTEFSDLAYKNDLHDNAASFAEPLLVNAAGQPRPHTVLDIEPSDVDFEPPLIQSLALLFKLLGKPVSTSFLLSGLPVAEIALRPSALIRAAGLGGMNAKTVYRATIKDISPLTLPCILLLRQNKSCVLVSYNDTSAEVLFPETGQTSSHISLEELGKEYTGYAIFGKLEGKLDKRASEIKLVKAKRWFWDTLLHFFPIYKHVLLASLVVNLLTSASPLFFMNVYDRVVPNGRNAFETLWALAVGIGLVYLFDFLLRNLRSYFVDVAGKNADMVLASRLMRHLMGLKLDSKPDSTGSLANNLREFDSLREFFGSTTLLALVDLPFLFFFLCIIGYIGGPLVFVPLAAIPVVVGAGFLSQFSFQRAVEAGYKETTQKNALLIEIINGLETVKSSLAEGRMQHAWENVVSMSAASSSRIKMLSNLTMTISVLATQMVSVLIIIWGVYRIDEQLMTMGALIACNMLSGRAMAPLSQLASMLARLQQSRMALKSLDMLMQLPVERPEDKQYVDFGELKPAFTLDKVYFKYPESERFALEDVNMHINPGEKVGFIGKMGSGKSTLGRLFMGLYEPTEGAVKLDGVDIRQLDIADLRSRVGYVSQDNYLFYGSVRDNIALGMPYADDRMILRAAAIAGVNEFIRAHPAGFGMPVGERGMGLSGGQRQAVAIARALLHDPDILIMDEPSSNMDNSSEHQFKQRLATIVKDKTLIIVTHRLSMLDLVDRLVIMDGGKIVADGPKDAVLRALRDEQVRSASAARNNRSPEAHPEQRAERQPEQRAERQPEQRPEQRAEQRPEQRAEQTVEQHEEATLAQNSQLGQAVQADSGQAKQASPQQLSSQLEQTASLPEKLPGQEK